MFGDVAIVVGAVIFTVGLLGVIRVLGHRIKRKRKKDGKTPPSGQES
ncbi:MAG: hypothetical protein ACLFWL_02835 [Candidatus Brocadiia bacterium]